MKFNTLDAPGNLAFAQEAAARLNAVLYATEYPEMDIASLVPINTNYDEWATISFSGITDRAGRAEWQSTFAKDVPMVDVTVRYEAEGFDEYAVGYQWNVGEIEKARRNNFPLQNLRASAGYEAANLFVYERGLIGDTVKGWGGLINHPQAQVIPAASTGTSSPTTAWVLNDGTGNKTPEEIMADINALIMGPQNSAIGLISNLLIDTILLPPAAYNYIAITPYGITAPGKSILQVILETNVYTTRTQQPLTIRELPPLSSAATVGVAGGGRAVGYVNRQEVLELPMPMAFRYFPVYQDGPFNFTVPGLGRIGALNLKRPALRYLDGITPVPPVLAALTLGTATASEGVAWTSTITGETTGSVISAVSDDGTIVTVTGGNAGLSATFATTGVKTITLTETLGLWGSKTSTVTVTVS